MTYRFIVFGLSVMAAGAAFGQEQPASEKGLRPTYYTCVKAARGVTLALNNCIGSEHDFQDGRLNRAYQQLRASLDPSKRIALREEERTWIGARDKACAPDESGGTASLLDTNQCLLDQTASRAAVLEARLPH